MATLAMGAIGSEAGMVLPGCATWQKRIRDGVESGAMASSTAGHTSPSDRCQHRGSTAMVATSPSRISTSAAISARSRLISARLHNNFQSRRDTCHCLSSGKDRRKAASVRRWRSAIAGQGASASTSTDPIERPQISDSAVLPEAEAAAAAAAAAELIAPEAHAEPAAATPSSTTAAAAAGDDKGPPAATLGSAETVAVSEATGRGSEPGQVSATGSDAKPPPAASEEAKPAAAAAAAEGKPAAAPAPKGKPAAAAAAAAKAKPAAARAAAKPKEPKKEFSQAMVEDVISPLQASLEKENITSLALSFQDNQLTGSFVKGIIPYTFNVYFPDGKFEGARGFSVSSVGRPPSTVEPFMIDERKVSPDLVVFWVMKRLYAQKLLP